MQHNRSHLTDVKNDIKDLARDAAHATKREMREMRHNAEDYLWTPFLSMQKQMARMLDENMRTFSSMADMWQGNLLSDKMLPKVRVWEDDKEFHLQTKLPSNNPDNVEVTVHDGFMTLKWEDEEAGRNGNAGQFRSLQSSRRTVMVPENADTEKAHAVCENGMLEVIVPKKKVAESRGRSIPIEKAR